MADDQQNWPTWDSDTGRPPSGGEERESVSGSLDDALAGELDTSSGALSGRIDDTGPERLRLSNEADFAEVDELRAQCDAILVGAGTLRNDDPRLLVRSERLRARRREQGLTENLLKAVVTRTGDLDPGECLLILKMLCAGVCHT